MVIGSCFHLTVTHTQSSVGLVTGHVLEDWGSNPARDKIILVSTSSRPALGPTEPPILWVPRSISSEVKRPGREADHFHLLPRSRMVELYRHSPIRLHELVLN
jgi:hypothetical protein